MLQVKHLTLTHRKDLRTLVDDFSFVLNQGDRAVLIGEEGNGKSTLLKWLWSPGLIEPYCEWSGELAGNPGPMGYLAQDIPAEEFRQLPTRVLDIAPETRATNCVGDLGGALEDMPKRCVTIGMKQILGAKKLRLAVFRDWHRAVCRRAAYGEPTASFPVTLAQGHPDALLIINNVAAQLPR